MSAESELMTTVLDGYVSSVRPVLNFTTAINVSIDIGLHQLIDLVSRYRACDGSALKYSI